VIVLIVVEGAPSQYLLPQEINANVGIIFYSGDAAEKKRNVLIGKNVQVIVKL